MKGRKDRRADNAHTFNVHFSEMENLVNYESFHLYPLTSLNNNMHTYCNLLLKLTDFV